MSGEGISTLAHRMINDVLRTSRRRFLTQVAAAGLGIGVPVSMTIAQETRRSLVGDGKEVSLGEKLARYATSLRYEDCMSSEHFGQLAWQFKRMSGSSGLKVQAAIAC